MRLETPTRLLTLAMFCVLLHDAGLAQDADDGGNDKSDPDTLTIEFSKTMKMEKRLGGCKANLQLEYWQKGDAAEVTSTLLNPECGASSGVYTVQIRYRRDDGETLTDDYRETWSREDSEPIVTTRLYPIGDNVDLIRVRSRGLSCSCDTVED